MPSKKVPNNIFGKTIRELRKRKGITLSDFATACGLNIGYLSCIERGLVKPPSRHRIIKIADLLDIDQDTVMYLARALPEDAAEVAKLYTKESTQALRRLGKKMKGKP